MCDQIYGAIKGLKQMMDASVVPVVDKDMKAASSGKVTVTRNKKTRSKVESTEHLQMIGDNNNVSPNIQYPS